MYLLKGNSIRISVRNLVEFIYCSGDIDNRNRGTSDARLMQEGIRLHRKIQKEMGPSYKAEVPLKLDIPAETPKTGESYMLTIEGRADGIICDFDEDEDGNRIPLSDVTVDEIKTTTRDIRKLQEPEYVHKAQALCYAYIYAVENEIESINVQITYCNIDTEFTKRFNEQYSFEMLSEWFSNTMDMFRKWTDFLFDSRSVRQKSIKETEFPFEYRKGQKKLVAGVYRSIENEKNLYIQAPTGVGKTISVIFPAVKAVGENYGDKIFYLTAKTITRTVAEDTFNILRDSGLKFRTATITAKDKICFLEKRECNPDACPSAKGHYDRVNNAVYDLVTHELSIDRDKISEYALKHNVCPFEMSLDVTYWCDGIICDYNYVFDPNVRLKRYFAEGIKGDYIFLIDEAHNLVDRAVSMYSAELCKEDFLEMKRILKGHDKKLEGYLEKCNKALLELKRECADYKVITSSSHFVMGLERLFSEMQKFSEENPGFEPQDTFSEFYLNVRHFLNMYEILDEKYITYTEHAEDGKFLIHLYCVDPSGNISMCIGQGRNAVFFSATLLPIQYFKEMLTGNTEENAIYAESPFDPSKRRLIISRDVSSRYTRRNVSEFSRICRYILAITAEKPGNYMVFFPSYSFMESVYNQMEGIAHEELADSRLKIVMQSSSMKESEKEAFLQNFEITEKSSAEDDGRETLIGFCVTGGIFSEGIDLKNDSLIGAFIVGTGLPMICNERQLLRQYFDENGKNGYQYAYVYPGMNKVLQAAGRVIRTEEDRGMITLLDDRFLTAEYQRLFPREWEVFYQTNVDNAGESAAEFWKSDVNSCENKNN